MRGLDSLAPEREDEEWQFWIVEICGQQLTRVATAR